MDPATPATSGTRWQRIVARIDAYERLLRLDKPIGTLLLLWPTLTALWLASDGRPRWLWIIVMTVGTLLMRSAGCAMNDWADRAFDAHVERTAQRPLATGEVQPFEALWLAAALAFVAIISTAMLQGRRKLRRRYLEPELRGPRKPIRRRKRRRRSRR